MKTTLIEAVMAHLAAKEMGRQILPYTLALAVVKVKQATQAEMDCYAAEEQKLVEQYAEKNGDGNITFRNGRFVFRDPADRPAYEAAKKRLGETMTDISLPRLTATPPENISPAALEALRVFIRFKEVEKV